VLKSANLLNIYLKIQYGLSVIFDKIKQAQKVKYALVLSFKEMMPMV
jgi:hypothetical protein